jgi:LuxR family transcriptional regulator, maltose regulon positive regulatory protein
MGELEPVPRPCTGTSNETSMLRAKLRRPQVPAHFIRRPRLHDLLEAVDAQPLTVVIAPAGSGKTSLVAGWIADGERSTAWLSLDDSDRDPAHFWFGFIAALEQLAPGSALQAGAALAHGQAAANVVSQLIDELGTATGSECVLVVDDVHIVDDVATSLTALVQHLPTWLHLVLVSRTDMGLPIDRWRGQGRLLEVRFPELRFSFAEACVMMQRLAPNLADDDLRDAANNCDGWAAGVQLSALAARSSLAQPEPRAPLVDSQVLIEDYIRHEILKAADRDVIDVLLLTAVVDRVNASLALALTERADAADLLLCAEARGLFVVRLGTGGGWFRIHPLVRSVLLEALSRDGRHVEQHRRAARWLEAAGETSDALDQWLLASEPREALRLLAASTSHLYDIGRESVIRRAIAAIPHAATSAEIPALLSFAFSHILVDRAVMVRVVEEAAWWAERSAIDDTVRAHLLLMQSMVASVVGDWRRTGPLAREGIAMLDRAGSDDPYGKFAWNAVARGVALLESWSDESADVRDATLATSRDPERGVSLEGIRAVGETLAGRPVDAIRVAAGVRHAAVAMSIVNRRCTSWR